MRKRLSSLRARRQPLEGELLTVTVDVEACEANSDNQHNATVGH